MLIYSQDKNKIINLDNVINIYIDNDPNSTEYTISCRYCRPNTYIEDLGTYSSIKRCKEVLNEIIDFYVDIQQIHSVYEMPEE